MNILCLNAGNELYILRADAVFSFAALSHYDEEFVYERIKRAAL